MDGIDEQYFETISGIEIRCSVLASANTLEILIANQRYWEERRRHIQQFLIIILFCISLNVLIQPHSVLIILNSIFLATIAIKCYVLVNLIKFGKPISFCLFPKCYFKIRVITDLSPIYFPFLSSSQRSYRPSTVWAWNTRPSIVLDGSIFICPSNVFMILS